MSEGEIQQGNVFLIADDRPSGVKHRHVVASDHNSDPSVVLLPIVTWENWVDDSCIITKQEYKPLAHDSCIDYRYGKVEPIAALQRQLTAGRIKRCPDVSSDVLAKILAGTKDSLRFLPSGCLDILSRQGLID